MELLPCPKCGAGFSGDTVNTETGLASCGSCSAVFTLGSGMAYYAVVLVMNKT